MDWQALTRLPTESLPTAVQRHLAESQTLGQQAAHQAEGYAFQSYAADVADWESCQRMAARIAADGHQVDIVVNNAGITRDATLKKLTAQIHHTATSIR